MATSSADPERLKAYPGRLTQADEALTTLAGDLDDAMYAFSSGAGTFRPAGFDADGWGGTVVRGLRDESQYQGSWVASVGQAFADAAVAGIPPDQLDAYIAARVGEPTLAEQRQAEQGRLDAEELQRQLQALGIDPDHFDPSKLRGLDPRDPRYVQLFDLMTRIGDNMWSPGYATGFYARLGTEGVRATVGVIETFAAHQVWTPTDSHDRPMFPVPDLGSIKERLLEPFVLGFALATRSPDLASTTAGLLDPGHDVNGDARWKQHQLSLLLSADGHNYDPAFLAAAADVILVSNRGVNWIDRDYGTYGTPYDTDYPALYIGPKLWDSDIELGVPQVIAMRALSQNDQASWHFAGMGRDNMEAFLRPETYMVHELGLTPGGSGYSYQDGVRLEQLMQQYGADITKNAFVDVPLADPTLHDVAVDRYADLVRIVGDGDIPDVTKRAVANSLALYVDDIGQAALVQSEGTFRPGQGFSRPEMVDFFKELGFDREAAAQVGESIGAWADMRAGPFVNGQPTNGDLTEAMRPLSLVMGTVEDGFDATDAAARASREAFATGLRHGAAFGVNFLIGLAASGGNPIAAGVWAGFAGTAGSVLLQGTDILASSAPGADVTGGQLENIVLGQLRQDLAVTVATQHQLPTPQPGRCSATLAQYRPDLRDALDNLDRDATDQKNDYGEEENWSSR